MAGGAGVKQKKKPDRADEAAAFGEEQMAAFGRELRRLRLDRGWSLQRMATESGISVAGIQKIERGLTNPSLQTAFSLSEALGQPLPDLVATARAARPPVVAASGQAPRPAHGLADFADDLAERRLCSRLAVVAPRSSLDADGLGGPLFLYVLRGRIRMQFGSGRVEALGPGDAIHMREELPLLLENTAPRRAVVLCVSDLRGQVG